MKRKLKILHVLKSNIYAGAENAAVTICRSLRSQFAFAYTSADGRIARYVRESGTTFYPMQSFSAKELKKVLDAFEPDIVHAHDFSASIVCASLKKDYFLISHLHHDPYWMKRWTLKSVACRLLFPRLDRILVVSEIICKEAVFLNRNDSRIVLVNNPVDTGKIRGQAEEYQAVASDLLYVGRFSKPKNPQRFIRIAACLKEQKPDITALMLGDGELTAMCRKLIQELDMEKNIRLEGFCRNPYPFMKQAKVLLVTSEREGYGMAAAEAVVLGTPVLAAGVGGLRCIFRDFPKALCGMDMQHAGGDGLRLMEADMCKKAGRLLSDPVYYASFRQEMCRSVHVEHMEKYMHRLEDIYQELGRKRGSV